MSKEILENDHPAALAMIEELCQRYPMTFTHEPHDVRPLARAIHKAIVADAPDLPLLSCRRRWRSMLHGSPICAPALRAHHASISVATPQTL